MFPGKTHMAELFREYFEEELGWAEFLNEEGADDNPEPLSCCIASCMYTRVKLSL